MIKKDIDVVKIIRMTVVAGIILFSLSCPLLTSAQTESVFMDPGSGLIVQMTDINSEPAWNSIRLFDGVSESATSSFKVTESSIQTLDVKSVFWPGYSDTFDLNRLNQHINKGDTIRFRLMLEYYEVDDGYQQFQVNVNNSILFQSTDFGSSNIGLEHYPGQIGTNWLTYYLDSTIHGDVSGTNMNPLAVYGQIWQHQSLSDLTVSFGATGNGADTWSIVRAYIQFRIIDQHAPDIVSATTHDTADGDYQLAASEAISGYSLDDGMTWQTVSGSSVSLKLEPGDYLLRVKDLAGHVSTSQPLTVSGTIDPTFTVQIPAAIQLDWSSADGSRLQSPFSITASDVVLADHQCLNVQLISDFSLSAPETSYEIPYTVCNSSGAVASASVFASFRTSGTQSGHVELDLADIRYAGDYSDTLTFSLSVAGSES